MRRHTLTDREWMQLEPRLQSPTCPGRSPPPTMSQKRSDVGRRCGEDRPLSVMGEIDLARVHGVAGG